MAPFPLALLPVLLAACSPAPTLDCQVTPSPAGAPTATVTWTTDTPAQGLVRYGTDGDLDVETQAALATAHSHLLLGLPPEALVDWEAEVDLDGDLVTCAGSVSTEPLPTWVTPVEVTAPWQGESQGAWMAAVFELGTYASQVLVFDRQGVVRWYHEAEDERFVVDVQPAADGQGLLHNQFHNRFSEDVGLVRHLSWEGQVLADTATPAAHHMFVQLPDGGLAWQAIDARAWTDPDSGETQTLVGDAILQVDAAGTTTQAWNAWDWLTPQENGFSSLPSIYPQGVDWTHGNALQYDEGDDTWLLSLGNAGSVLTIDRGSGEPARIVGAYGLPVAAGSPALEHQHDPTWLSADRLLVFDSHFDELVSSAYEYTLVDGELVLSWQYTPEESLFAVILGQAQRLSDGGTWVNFGSAGVIEEVDAAGALRWRARLDGAHGFAQVRWLPDFPTP